MPDNENIFPVNKVVQWLTAPSNQVEKINNLKETKLIKNNGIQCLINDITGAGLNIRFKVKSPSETAILALSHIENNKFWKSWEVSGSVAKLIKDYLEQHEPLDFQKLNYESVPLDKVVDWVGIEAGDWSKLIGGYIENHDTEFYKVISLHNDVSKIILKNKSDNSEQEVVLTDLLNKKTWIKGYFSSKIIIEILNQIPDPVEQKNYLKLKDKYHVQGALFSRLSKNDTTPVRKIFNALKLIDENEKYIPSRAEIDSFEDNKLQGLLAEIYLRLFKIRKDVGKLAKASSYFRLINLSKKSVEITEEFSKKPFGKDPVIAMVLTSRAAALKDCKKHSAAEQELKRAISYQRGISTYFLGDYIPKNRNIEDYFSDKILKFKDGEKEQINDFANQIITKYLFLNQYQFTFCRVPSSDKENIVTSCNRLIDELINLSSQTHVNGSLLLKRHTSIPSQHKSSGPRLSVEEHIKTINLDFTFFKEVYGTNFDENNISGKKIILIDDITTSGNSIESCTSILFQHKAKKIIQIVLGKTKDLK